MVQTGDKLENRTTEDFVNFCRFQIALEKGMLFHDPIWNTLSEEEIIVEYQALLFAKRKEELAAFESQKAGDEAEDEIDWLEAQVAKNQAPTKAYNEEESDEFEFTPQDLKKDK